MSSKGFIALDPETTDNSPMVDNYGHVLWFKSIEDARAVMGDKAKIIPLVRAIVPRKKRVDEEARRDSLYGAFGLPRDAEGVNPD